MDLLEARHDRELEALRQEMREQIKKAKKSEKAVMEAKAIQMEFDMKARHREEMEDFEERGILSADISAAAAEQTIAETASHPEVNQEEIEREKIEQKKEKAKRKKDKKAQKEKEKQEEKAQLIASTAGIKTARDFEIEALEAQLSSLQLRVKDIPSDGHCLYRAIADQFRAFSLSLPPSLAESHQSQVADYQLMRQIAANHLRSHSDDYAPFLGLIPHSSDYDTYCETVASTAEWGGQLELRALAEALNVNITVHSANCAPLEMLAATHSPQNSPTIQLSFHRHLFNLGEHYNAVVSR